MELWGPYKWPKINGKLGLFHPTHRGYNLLIGLYNKPPKSKVISQVTHLFSAIYGGPHVPPLITGSETPTLFNARPNANFSFLGDVLTCRATRNIKVLSVSTSLAGFICAIGSINSKKGPFPMVGMVINLVVGVYIPLPITRTPY